MDTGCTGHGFRRECTVTDWHWQPRAGTDGVGGTCVVVFASQPGQTSDGQLLWAAAAWLDYSTWFGPGGSGTSVELTVSHV